MRLARFAIAYFEKGCDGAKAFKVPVGDVAIQAALPMAAVIRLNINPGQRDLRPGHD